eukprot:CAMPEP_0179216864 /NCGR_PEP_ID=MMETSP0797-20121207/3611_1 /TAXON_ID=47934 /ORGANISM="Dinophysis acuminata, Strain DAEP01" /LENGTH=236 /DNA_ID=CAMNT_0020923061 /DNA_START=226 /DNA_END=936 /DNA_ORIENTATION=-
MVFAQGLSNLGSLGSRRNLAYAQGGLVFVDLLHYFFDIEALGLRIRRVVAPGQPLHDARVLVGGVAELLEAPVGRVKPRVQEVEERTITEGVAVLPQEVVGAPGEVRAQGREHLLAGYRREAHVQHLRWGVRQAAVRLQVRPAGYALEAKRELHAVHRNGGVVGVDPREAGPQRRGRELHPVALRVQGLEGRGPPVELPAHLHRHAEAGPHLPAAAEPRMHAAAAVGAAGVAPGRA